MEEIWKDVVGFEGYYQVSNLGRIKRLKRIVSFVVKNHHYQRIDEERVISQEILSTGYVGVRLCVNGKRKRLHMHRIVAEAFLPNTEKKQTVNHKDGDKTNNKVENLEWASYSENNYHAWRVLGKRSYNEKKVMCIETGDVFDSIKKAEEFFGVSHSCIWNALRDNRKTSCGYHWRHV